MYLASKWAPFQKHTKYKATCWTHCYDSEGPLPWRLCLFCTTCALSVSCRVLCSGVAPWELLGVAIRGPVLAWCCSLTHSPACCYGRACWELGPNPQAFWTSLLSSLSVSVLLWFCLSSYSPRHLMQYTLFLYITLTFFIFKLKSSISII